MRSMDRSSIRFLLLTYGCTWLLWLPALVQSFRGEPLSPTVIGIGIPGMMVPSLMGLVFLRREKPFRAVFRELFLARPSRWLLVAFALLPVVVLLAHFIHIVLFDGTAPAINDPGSIPLLFLTTMVAGGPLFEEIGWRGFLQGQLLQRNSILATGLLMGIFWGIWHFPLFLIKGMFHEHIPIGQFIITVLLMSVIMAFMQVKAKAGIWPALILHTFMNLTQEVTPLFNSSGHVLWSITNVLLAAVVLGGWFLSRHEKPALVQSAVEG
jgi:membrane protease YdiL (CAAX protease family)